MITEIMDCCPSNYPNCTRGKIFDILYSLKPVYLNAVLEKYLFGYNRANSHFICDLVSNWYNFRLVVAVLCLGLFVF